MKSKINKYPKEIDAAYYALSRFISPVDYVVRYFDEENNKQIATMNPNCVIVANMSKYDLFKPNRISKFSFEQHFNRTTILFYKSPPNSPYFTGYGKRDSEAQKLLFSAELEVSTRKQIDKNYCVLLVGIDIDCHNEEKHVHEVKALIQKYLPHAYWEESTNGKGLHGYLKLKFKSSYGVIQKISSTLKKLFQKLNELKKLYGFEAKIDKPAGLPYKYEAVKTNPYYENWTTLYLKIRNKKAKIYEYKFLGNSINPKSKLWQNYISYLKNETIYPVRKICEKKPAKLTNYLKEHEIKKTFTEYLQKNNITFPPPKNKNYHKITVQRAFKVPLFGAVPSPDGSSLPRMDCVQRFHLLPYYDSSDIKTVYKQICNDLEQRNIDLHLSTQMDSVIALSDKDFDQIQQELLQQSQEQAYALPVPIKGEEKVSSTRSFHSLVSASFANPAERTHMSLKFPKTTSKEEINIISNNCAYTNTSLLTQKCTCPKKSNEKSDRKYAKEIKWEELIYRDFEIDSFWKDYHQGRYINSKKYDDVIAELQSESDTFRRTALFIAALINKIGRNPELEEALDEYVQVGLNRNPALRTLNRVNRFRSCLRYYEDHYDESVKGYTLNWKKECNSVINIVKPYLPIILKYKQGKKVKSYTIEESAFVYYIIQRMDEEDQHVVLSNSLTYDHADKLFMQTFGKKCGRNKLAQILKVLQENNLIKKIGSYKVGLKGNSYRVKTAPD